jgi:Ca2+-binding EF-hand superfamily protein
MRYALLLPLAAATALLLATPVRAQQSEADRAQQWFLQHDRNHDGYITLDEVMGYETKVFQRMDQQGNGRLREDEYCAGIPQTNTAEVDHCHALFTKIDKDGDAYITLDEIQAYYGTLLQAADTDHDGRVSLQEFLAIAGQP